jgi:hypothetical protein
VTQLKTQIEDLERFIDFLQGEASSPGPYIHKKNAAGGESNTFSFGHQQSKSASNKASNYERVNFFINKESLKAKFHNGFVNRWRKQTSLQSSF